LTPSGKLDRVALAALAECGPAPLQLTRADSHVAPPSEREQVLTAIWRELLGMERIGTTDDFFALGGNSLLAVQVVLRVQEAFAIEVALSEFYERPTIAGLSDALQR
jgi:acyl carrier protein